MRPYTILYGGRDAADLHSIESRWRKRRDIYHLDGFGRGGGDGRGLGVGVTRGNAVGEGVTLGVVVGVAVAVGVEVAVAVAVGVGVGVELAVGVGVDVGLELGVVVGVGVGVGVPVVLFTIAPNVPTPVALFGSGKETPQSPSATPLCSCSQELPPSVVRRTRSPKPTAVPLLASAKETAVRIKIPGGVLGTQVVPPSVV